MRLLAALCPTHSLGKPPLACGWGTRQPSSQQPELPQSAGADGGEGLRGALTGRDEQVTDAVNGRPSSQFLFHKTRRNLHPNYSIWALRIRNSLYDSPMILSDGLLILVAFK